MKLLDITEEYWKNTALPDLEKSVPEALPYIAAGLAGNGSECFGYDDEYSMDHDWGVDFFIWVEDNKRELIEPLKNWKKELFKRLPPEHVRTRSNYGAVIEPVAAGDFFYSLIGMKGPTLDLYGWLRAPESSFAMAVNGRVFYDGSGRFTQIRNSFKYYPEDIRLKKIVKQCMMMAQTGQYNLGRMAKRGDYVTAGLILSKFMEETMHMAFALNRVYMPYYKWAYRKLKELPLLGEELSGRLEELSKAGPVNADTYPGIERSCEEICLRVADILTEQGLSQSHDSFLAAHGESVHRLIEDKGIASLPLQY